MADRPLRFGPDPNRTYLERWNEMHPDRYGRPDSQAGSSPHRRHSLDGDAESDSAIPSVGLLESLLGAAIFLLAPITALIVTLLSYQWTRPDTLTTAWIFGYASVFVVAMLVCGVLAYVFRRVLLALALSAFAFGVGYLAWHSWLS